MTETQRHWTIAKTKDGTREAAIEAAIARLGVKGISELMDRLLYMEEMLNGAIKAQITHNEKSQEGGQMRYPKMQRYEPARHNESVSIDVSSVTLRRGEFVQIRCDELVIEVRRDDNGVVGICSTQHMEIQTFEEVYGG